MRKAIGVILKIILALCLVVAIIIGLMVVFEFNPEYIEDLTISGKTSKVLTKGSEINIILYDVNYLTDIKSGGNDSINLENIHSQEDDTNKYLEEISKTLYSANPMVGGGADIALLHRVYYESKEIPNQYRQISDKFNGLATYASNYDSFFGPDGSLGNVNVGNCSLSKFEFMAHRLWLPETQKFPDIVFSYKPGIIKQTMNIDGQDNKLIVFSCYLYEDGKNQIEYIKKYIRDEYEAGNYVVFGGTFSGAFKESIGEIDEGLKLLVSSDDACQGFIISSNISSSSINAMESGFGTPLKLKIKL